MRHSWPNHAWRYNPCESAWPSVSRRGHGDGLRFGDHRAARGVCDGRAGGRGDHGLIRLGRLNALAFDASLGNLPRVVPADTRKPLWLYPNLLSLDAPLVAVAWLHVFAQTWRLGYHPWEAYIALGLTVWIIYVADRLLDVSLAGGPIDNLEARHRFHRRHQNRFKIALGAAALVTLYMVITKMPVSLYSNLIPGGLLLAGFFGLSMLSSQDPNVVPHSKNVIAGVTFAFGTAMTAHVYRFEYGIYDMLVSREFVCFSVLCILNISAIDLWEHAARTQDLEVKSSDELALTLPLALLAGASLLYALMDSEQASRPFFYAILTGAALLHVLNRSRARFSMDALRVLADVALLIPVLVFMAASRG